MYIYWQRVGLLSSCGGLRKIERKVQFHFRKRKATAETETGDRNMNAEVLLGQASSVVQLKPSPVTLPSFRELVTSIPLPHEFKEQACAQSLNSKTQVTLPIQFTQQASRSPYYSQNNPPAYNNISIHRHNPYTLHDLPGPEQKKPRIHPRSFDAIIDKHKIPTPPPSIDTAKDVPRKLNPRKYVCKVCSRSFTTSGHLARHNRIHTGERKHVCPWPTCSARFARQDNCMQHYKTHKNNKRQT